MAKVKSFSEAASTVGRQVEEEAPARPPFACAAFGCPIAGSFTIAGRRTCCVHTLIREMSTWDAATAVLRRRPSYVEALRVLRNPGDLSPEQALEHARQLVPALSPKHRTVYEALVAIETRLIALAKQAAAGALDPDDPAPLEPGGSSSVVEQIRMAARRLSSDHRARVSEG